MKLVLITGASGFIGAHLIARLRHDGVSIRALVHERDEDVPAGVEPVRGDVRDLGALRAAADGADAVAHLAGRVHALSEVRGDAALYDAINVEGTRNVLKAALDRGVGRVLFFSSVKAMGEGGPVWAGVPVRDRLEGVVAWELCAARNRITSVTTGPFC